MTIFMKWIVEFLDQAEIDIETKVIAGDGTELDVGDVIAAIIKASEWDQNKIRKQMLQCKAKGIPMVDLFKEYAKALNKNCKRDL